MEMIVEYDIRMEKQTFSLSAKAERVSDNVRILLAGEYGQPSHNRGGYEMRRFWIYNFIAVSHDDDVSKRSFER